MENGAHQRQVRRRRRRRDDDGKVAEAQRTAGSGSSFGPLDARPRSPRPRSRARGGDRALGRSRGCRRRCHAWPARGRDRGSPAGATAAATRRRQRAPTKRSSKVQSDISLSSRMLSRPGRPHSVNRTGSAGSAVAGGAAASASRSRASVSCRFPRRGGESPIAGPPPSRREILPVLAAGVERVDVDLHHPGQRREDRAIELGAERHPEDVDGGRRGGCAQRGQPAAVEKGGQGDGFPHLRLPPRLRREHPLSTEQRQPQLSLPALQSWVGTVYEAPLAPDRQHVGAREGVAVEQVRQRGRELDPPAIAPGVLGLVVALVVRAQIAAHRLQIP